MSSLRAPEVKASGNNRNGEQPREPGSREQDRPANARADLCHQERRDVDEYLKQHRRRIGARCQNAILFVLKDKFMDRLGCRGFLLSLSNRGQEHRQRSRTCQ